MIFGSFLFVYVHFRKCWTVLAQQLPKLLEILEKMDSTEVTMVLTIVTRNFDAQKIEHAFTIVPALF